MLKFRLTNSVKARRAAEAQRKALEEKLQLEWAWKPMAAMMNEDQTDLVYWIPPLYHSNIVTTTTTRRPSITARTHSLTQAPSQRKKKLARRRAKLVCSDDSYEDLDDSEVVVDTRDTDTLVGVKDLRDDDNESGIHDEMFETSSEDNAMLSIHCIEEEERDVDDDSTLVGSDFITVSDVTTSSEVTLKASEKQPEVEVPKKVPEKHSTKPTIMRLLEKLSHMHGIPGNPLSTKNKKNKEVRVDSKKARRPSVKVYHNPPTARLSNRRTKATNQPVEEPCIIVSLDPPTTTTKPPTATTDAPGVTTAPEKEALDPEALRHAQLQMILRLLAQLYEDKVSRQDTEIQNLKTRLQTQDKLMKQMAHLVLGLKEEVTKMKKQRGLLPDRHLEKQYNVLSIKVGDGAEISC